MPIIGEFDGREIKHHSRVADERRSCCGQILPRGFDLCRISWPPANEEFKQKANGSRSSYGLAGWWSAVSFGFAGHSLGLGVDALPAPMRSQVAATQTIRQDLVLGYWAEMLAETPAELQRRIDAVADAIAVPYLAIMGQTLSDVDREHLRRHVRGAQIEVWPGRGHMVHLAEPDRFAERLAAFVRDCADL